MSWPKGYYASLQIFVDCKQCGNLFHKTASNRVFCSKVCYKVNSKENDIEYQRAYRAKTPEKQLLRSAKTRAISRGIEFNIDVSDIEIPEVCPVLGITLVRHLGSAGGRPNSPSLDRIDPTKGYTRGNVQVISHLANSMKSAATTDHLLKFAKWVNDTYGK